ncbi:endonuclease NucS domain-containing protein [Bacillus sp. Marseille-P3661]|uniref:endonuclease NucS domain-containing protein n=1 Tax=Bacillus sp. Marseille-P3661 TaxID=1936234 RepID=UPI000C84E9A2|nr:endonuclease NucS domain-containing protein [Bacillus sp. Marseille-P3661]
MQSYLIPYIDPRKNDGEEDPMLHEFTYGDVNNRGSYLRYKVEKGDYLFFHTNIRGKSHLTAYYYVEQVCAVEDAKQNPLIMGKYKNPHLYRKTLQENETIVFGHSVYSKVLSHPLPLTDKILNKLSRRPKSIARPWVKINKKDIDFLLTMIKEHEEEGFLEDTYLMTEEIEELLESDIESFIHKKPMFINENIEPFERQLVLESGKRIDLLFKEKNADSYVLVEVKNTVIGRDAYYQLKGYLDELKETMNAEIKGVIVCKGILPIAEKFYIDKLQKERIEIYFHVWKFDLIKY